MRTAQTRRTRPRVGIISLHPAPYRDPTLAALHRRGLVDVQVLTLFELDKGHAYWNLGHPAYPNLFLGKGYQLRPHIYYHPQILSTLHHGHFDVIVVPGYTHLTTQLAINYCCITRTPLIFSCDTVHFARRRDVKYSLRNKLLRVILRRSAAVWVPGTASRRYAREHGMREEQIFEGCYNLDCAKIETDIAAARGHRDDLRLKLGLPHDAYVLLMVANLIPKRQHRLLLQAFQRVADSNRHCYLVCIGKGSEQASLEEYCLRPRSSNVRLVRPVAFDDLPEWYCACDAYVHSGCEPYSTAVAHAAIAGHPIVCAASVGAAYDYVIDGVTGHLAEPNDAESLTRGMLQLCSDRGLAYRMGQRAKELAMHRTPTWAAQQLEYAVSFSLAEHSGPNTEALCTHP
jgi:glycosyltransferase involved in cell wall biosynthesis